MLRVPGTTAITSELNELSAFFVSSRGEGITSNKTYSFLITLDLDIGELVMIKFKWENSAVWANIWNTVQTIFPWGTKPHYSGLVLKTIRAKAGETQQR
jgi:triacylglycerol lipase